MKVYDQLKYFSLIIFCFLFLFSGCTPENLNIETTVEVITQKIENTESFTQSRITLVDGLNREVTLDKPASRIISLAPSNTEILFAINAGSQMVGRDTLSDYPEAAKEISDVGGNYGEYDIEKIISLNPDLVIATNMSPVELVTKLEELNITVYYLPEPKNIEGMYENLLTVGQLTDHNQEAELLVEGLKKRVELINDKLQNIQERPVVFYEIDGTDASAPWTSGEGTFLDTLINMAGGKNLGSILGVEWAQISIEEIIAQDPDLILLGDAIWGGVTVDDVKSRPGWDALTAVKNNRVYEFDDNIVSRPGPRLVDGLEALAKLLHPEVFQPND